jgi:ABC-type multidrug transport system fused ATPase/permease subunit
MRRSLLSSDPNSTPPARGDLKVLRMLAPYLWEYRGRLVLALSFLVLAKLANVGVPLIMKQVVDSLDQPKAVLMVPVFLRTARCACPRPCSPSCAIWCSRGSRNARFGALRCRRFAICMR